MNRHELEANQVLTEWIVRDLNVNPYLPEIGERELTLPTLRTTLDVFGDAVVETLKVPADCMDGVLGAFWQRPQAYLSESLRNAMSGVALTDQNAVQRAMQRLEADLENGTWHRRYAQLLELEELDIGYRLVRGVRHQND